MKKFNNNVLPVVGMSPGNSYFTQERVLKLLKKVVDEYSCALVFVPDIPAISTYEALGYSVTRARNKAVSKGNNLKNKTQIALSHHSISCEDVYIINWARDIDSLPEYIHTYKKVFHMFESNQRFRSAILETSSHVLENSGKILPNLAEASLKASHYILSEFAFLELCPTFFSSREVRYIYHKEWPVYERYIYGDLDGINRKHLGFEQIVFD